MKNATFVVFNQMPAAASYFKGIAELICSG